MECNRLPPGWKWKVLPQIADLKNGGTPPKSKLEYWSEGAFPFLTAADLTHLYVSEGRTCVTDCGLHSGKTVVCEPGDVLIGTRTRVGNCSVAQTRMAASQDVTRARLNDQCLPEYLCLYLQKAAYELSFYSQGTSIQGITRDFLSKVKVPVPPVAEQRRIVEWVEKLAARMREVKKWHEEMEHELYKALLGAYHRITSEAECRPMSDVAPLRRRPVKVESQGTYYELGIRSFGKGTFHKPAVLGADLGSKRIYTIGEGDLLFHIVFAWEGAVAVARPEDDGRVGSHRFLTCVPRNGVATSPFLLFHFLTERGLHDLGDASPGGAGRNRTLGLNALGRIMVPVPSFEEQRWFTSIWEKVEQIRQLRIGISPDLSNFTPSLLAKAFRGEL